MASPEMTNLADLLSRAAAEHPSRVAIKLDGSEVSYAALDEAASRAAALLTARGVPPGDRVGIMLPNVAYFSICYYGALRSGAAVVLMNVLLKEREVAFHLGDSGAKVLLAWHQVYPREVEDVLYEHPDVRLAAVIGIPHDQLGEEVGAAIVLKSGSDTTASALRDFVKQRIAVYKYPRHIWFVDDLPVRPTGKILKREIAPPAGLTPAESPLAGAR